MRTSGTWRIWLSGAAALVCAAFAAAAQAADSQPQAQAPASALAKATTVRSTPVTVAPGTLADYEAPCLAGEKAISGGWSVNRRGLSWPNAISAHGSRPETDAGSGISSWTVRLLNPTGDAARGTVYATCVGGAAAADVTIRAHDANVQPPSTSPLELQGYTIELPAFPRIDVVAPCAPGEKAIAGGWNVRDLEVIHTQGGETTGLFAQSSQPGSPSSDAPDAWTVGLVNTTDTPARVTVFAACANGAAADAVAIRRAAGSLGSGVQVNPTDMIFVGADLYGGCTAGEKVIGGGFVSDQPQPYPGLMWPTVDFVEEHPTGTENFGVETWNVVASNLGPSGEVARTTVFSSCAA